VRWGRVGGASKTGNPDRDAHIRAADLLDVQRRPTMTFRSTRVHGHGVDWSMEGELTIGEVTRPVTFEVDFGGIETFVIDDRRHAGFEARGEIRRSDFALGFGVLDAGLSDVRHHPARHAVHRARVTRTTRGWTP
jgi:polyisoprenoid-binding protein YceI